MKTRLTKTAYLNYLACPQEFWLDYHDPELIKRHTNKLEYEHLRQQGYAVEQFGRQIARFRPNEKFAVDFQRVFQTAALYARADITVTEKTTGFVELFEIKSSASVKPEHLDDLAFQKMVAEDVGFAVTGCYVLRLNGDYVRHGEINPEELFVIEDITAQVQEHMDLTYQQSADAIAYLDTDPVPSLVDYCVSNKLDCRFIKQHFPSLPEYTVFDIAFLKNDKRRDLLSRGIVAITDVPEDFALSSKQREQVNAAKSGEIAINQEEIAIRLASWKYPLHFLDYETFSYAVPQFDGVRPFQQMCFQYSLHTIENPGGELKHSQFLSRGSDDPPRSMAESLREAMSDGIGTVLVWYEGFEKTRNAEMALMFPEYADFFEEVNSKTADLMKIFSDKLYIHPAFKGSSSIKKVLPILVPELSYTELGIGDGLTASISWFRAATWDTVSTNERETIFSDLEIYCHLDTLAMVEIFNRLNALVFADVESHAFALI